MTCSCNNEPYEGPIITDGELSCTIASELTEVARNDFLNSDSGNFIDNCSNYRAALEQQLLSCPDTGYNSLALIDQLNNCETNSFFKVDFDNDTYTALSAEAHLSYGALTITGRRDNKVFELILNETDEGTYQFGIPDVNNEMNTARYIPNATLNESWDTATDSEQSMGEITISELNYSNLKVSGTFNFTGKKNDETKAFVNGVFINIPLIKDNEFFALVDGEEFEDTQIIPYVNQEAEWFGFVLLNQDVSENMDFTFHRNTLPGTYNFGMIPQLPRAGYTANSDYYYHASGSVTITAHNRDLGFVMGTFEFNADFEGATPESYTVTEGSFCLSYF